MTAVAPVAGTRLAPVAGTRLAPVAPTRLEVDWTRCDGHGVCAALLPSVITRDDWGYPIIDADAATSAGSAALNRIVTACPALALRRVETRTEGPRR